METSRMNELCPGDESLRMAYWSQTFNLETASLCELLYTNDIVCDFNPCVSVNINIDYFSVFMCVSVQKSTLRVIKQSSRSIGQRYVNHSPIDYPYKCH